MFDIMGSSITRWGDKMKKFESFCKNIHKTDAGYVPDLLDLVAQGFGDLCMAAFLADKMTADVGVWYMESSNEAKNQVYALWEIQCQDAIDAYNQTIDDAREADSMMDYLRDDSWGRSLVDPDYKYARFNQAEIDAGYSGTGREFC
jgi:hypothetical protein